MRVHGCDAWRVRGRTVVALALTTDDRESARGETDGIGAARCRSSQVTLLASNTRSASPSMWTGRVWGRPRCEVFLGKYQHRGCPAPRATPTGPTAADTTSIHGSARFRRPTQFRHARSAEARRRAGAPVTRLVLYALCCLALADARIAMGGSLAGLAASIGAASWRPTVVRHYRRH